MPKPLFCDFFLLSEKSSYLVKTLFYDEATPMMVVSVQRNIFNPITHMYQKIADPIRLGGAVTIPLFSGGEAKYEVIASK